MTTKPGEPLAWLQEAVATAAEECQFWPFQRSPKGYARIYHHGRKIAAYHVAMELAGQEAPVAPLEARHLCGNGHLGCVNFRHLTPGTRKQNMADAIEHGTIATGERHGMAKLTAADVLAIRASTEDRGTLAARYGIRKPHVWRIQRRVSWKHI